MAKKMSQLSISAKVNDYLYDLLIEYCKSKKITLSHLIKLSLKQYFTTIPKKNRLEKEIAKELKKIV